MNAIKKMSVLSLLSFLLSLLVASCVPKQDTSVDVAVIVALTQTASALQNPAPSTQLPAAQDVQPPLVVAASGYLPLNSDECYALNNNLSSAIGYPGAVMMSAPFQDFVNSQYGTGCQISFATTGRDMDSFDGLASPARSGLLALGWQEDTNYGAGGAGGYMTGFRKDATLCLMIVSAEPSDPSLCSSNEPIVTCWERLSPEQKHFNLTLNCSTYTP